MNIINKKYLALGLAGLALALSAAMLQASDDDEHENEEHEHSNRSRITMVNTTWQTECAECHIAYPPNLLPRESWQAIMSGLEDHFGTDASLDAETHSAVSAFLAQHSRPARRKTSRPVLRITQTNWFRHEHDEVSSSVWKSEKIKSPSNCSACHSQAEKGNFDEDSVRIPR